MIDTAGRDRPKPPPAGDETATLLGFLDYHRATLEWKCAGIDAAGLRTRLGRSAITLGGLLKHLAFAEYVWFSDNLFGNGYPPPFDAVVRADDLEWEWRTAADDAPDELWAMWRDAVAHSRTMVDRALADGGLDRPATFVRPDGRSPSLRWILVHMVEEYARHNGHADLIRESIDGATGY